MNLLKKLLSLFNRKGDVIYTLDDLGIARMLFDRVVASLKEVYNLEEPYTRVSIKDNVLTVEYKVMSGVTMTVTLTNFFPSGVCWLNIYAEHFGPMNRTDVFSHSLNLYTFNASAAYRSWFLGLLRKTLKEIYENG
nr:MAG TPA: hypothetical protein [Caudoviricetes sp.]